MVKTFTNTVQPLLEMNYEDIFEFLYSSKNFYDRN